MKLTNDLKKKLEAAKTKEEAKEILDEAKKNMEDAGIILDDTELDQVAGGGAYDEHRGEIGNWHFV